MRLHLPKALLAAVLAACLAWPAGAFTSTTTTYTSGDTSTTFNGDIWTWNNNGDKVSSGNASYTKYSDTNVTYAGNAGNTGGPTYFYNYFFDSAETTNLGNTLRFSGASGDKTLTTDFENYVWIGGIITESGDYTYTLGRNAKSNFKLNGTNAVNMVINSSFTFKANNDSSLAVEKGGTWSIAKGKTLTFNIGTTNIAANQTVNVSASGDGTGNASLTFSGAVTNNGALNIGSSVLLKVSESINNVGSITFNSGVSIDLNQLIKASQFTTSATTTGFHTATGGSFTFATGTGTVTATDSPSCLYDGVSATVCWADDHKTGTITSVGYYYIAENDTKNYSEAITDTPAWITVGERGTLSTGSGTIDTEINGGGTISVSAGSGELSVSAEKLREFTGNLVVNSGRFNEVNNGHVFSNVSVADGGQFSINDSYNYTGNVSIAGTGWSNTSDYAWNGALRLGSGATLSGNLTLTGDANLIVYNGAKGTLSGTLDTGGHTLTVKGNGKLLFGSSVVIGSGEGNANIVAENALIGVSNNGSLSILKNYTCKGLYSDGQGTITIGDATHTIVNSVERIELGDSGTSGKITTLTVSANSVLKITGTNNDSGYKSASALLGEWSASTTANINGTLLAEGAALQAGDTGYTLNIESTGLVAAKGIQRAKSDKNPTVTVNLKGGSLILGDGGIAANGTYHSATSTGGVIGSYADTTTIASGLSLTSGTTTIDTSKYTINADNTVTVGEGAPGSTITIDGIISGSGTLKVSGGGILVLNGNNTYTYETRLSGGEIQAGHTNAFGTSKLVVDGKSSISGTATIGDCIGIEEGVVLTIKENSAITLGNTGTYKGMWVKAGSSVVLKNGASVTGYGVTVSHLNDNSKLAAESGGEGQFGISGQLNEEKLTIKESAISLADQATLRNKLDGGTVSSTGSTTIGWLDENGTHGGGSISSLADTSASDTLKVASDLAVTKSAAIAGTLNIGEKATTAINSAREDNTASSIGTLTGSGTLKATGGTTEVTNASGFSGTLEASGGSLTANGTTTVDSNTVTLGSLSGLKATGGSIVLEDVETTLTVTDLVVSDGGSISGADSYTANKVSIGAGEAGSLVGNLSIQDGGTITLDASAGATTATGGTKGLSLSALTTTFADEGTTTTTGSLTLGSGLTLNLANLGRLATGESLTLFSGVTEVKGLTDENLTALEQGTLAAETVFSSGVGTGNYNLHYSGSAVSIVALQDTPEPTTATLSLLALMALAARRRRKA